MRQGENGDGDKVNSAAKLRLWCHYTTLWLIWEAVQRGIMEIGSWQANDSHLRLIDGDG